MNFFIKTVAFFFIFNTFSYSQTDKIVFESTNNNYSTIELPTFKGLPRFGIFSQSRYNPEIYKTIYVNNNNDGVEINKYFYLLELKYLSEYYEALDENMPTSFKVTSNYNIPDNFKKPLFAEKHLNKIVKKLRATETKNKFFQPYDINRNMATKIDRVSAYKAFLKTEYADLRTWTNTLWENDEVIGYSVVEVVVGQYNIQGQGYFLSLGENQNNFTYGNGAAKPNNFSIKFKSKPGYNKGVGEIFNNKGRVLFEFPESKAEILEESFKKKRYVSKGRKAYLVLKIKLYRGNNDTLEDNSLRYSPLLELLYNIVSPSAEIYQDFELTKKLGDIDLEDLIFKN